MKTPPFPFPWRVGAAALAALAFAGSAPAVVVQRVEVISDLDTVLLSDPFDDQRIVEVSGPTSADITTASFGALLDSRSDPGIGLVNYQASAAIGVFGSVGLSAGLSGAIFADEIYELSTRVIIESDEFVNLGGTARRARANFIIDGGSMFMEAGAASMEFELFVQGENLGNVPGGAVPDDFPLFLTGPQFFAGGLFEAPPGSGGGGTFTPRGRDIGAQQTGPNRVEIPLSFQTLDLGLIGPGERLALLYDFTFTLRLDGPGAFSEGMFAAFSDPLNVANRPVLEVVFEPLVNGVPAPPTLLLAAGGVLLIAGLRRRNPRRRDPG